MATPLTAGVPRGAQVLQRYTGVESAGTLPLRDSQWVGRKKRVHGSLSSPPHPTASTELPRSPTQAKGHGRRAAFCCCSWYDRAAQVPPVDHPLRPLRLRPMAGVDITVLAP